MKQVRETSAGKSISAYVILNKKCKEIASVHAHYSDNGVCLVDVWDFSRGELQQARAGGGGYDKFTACLMGLTIDGIKLTDNCGTDKRTEKILKQYIDGKITAEEATKKANRIGARFANYRTFFNGIPRDSFEGDQEKAEVTHRWTSLYLEPGLDKLTALGYTVIQAI